MNFIRVVIGAIIITAAVIGWETTAATEAAGPRTPAVSDTGGSHVTHDVEAPRLDLYGNEVDFAVGDYRVDGAGDLYETHSPQTEVPLPGTPTI